jgi:hypothetical protein
MSRAFWEEYVRPESMIVDTLGVYYIFHRKRFEYRIAGNFCGVMTFNFWGFFFLQIENLGTEKKLLYYRKQQLKRCCDKQLMHITVILRSKNIFSSLDRKLRSQQLDRYRYKLWYISNVYCSREYSNDCCLRWISASIGYAPISKYTALTAVLWGRDCMYLIDFRWKPSRRLIWVHVNGSISRS